MRSKPFKGRITLGQFSTLRKTMRAVRRNGLALAQPTEKVLMKNAWYRKKKAMAALRAYLAGTDLTP